LAKDEELKTMRHIQDELHQTIADLRQELQKNRKEEDIQAAIAAAKEEEYNSNPLHA